MSDWRATKARGVLSKIGDGAAGGVPYPVEHPARKAVVVVSKARYGRHKLSLMDYLRRSGGASECNKALWDDATG